MVQDLNHIKEKQLLSLLTGFLRALDALPRNAGSKARRVHKRPKEDGGRSLKVSTRLGL
jgi:hypothetical protein